MSDSLIIIPTYNEKENIGKMLKTLMSLPFAFDVLIIDDNSKDGTAAIVKDYIQQFPNRIFIEERSGKLGLGTAYIHGFKWALKKEYEYIFEMDADFSHNPNDLMRLRDACVDGNADMSIGSRYITGVNVVNWPMGRVMMSYFASMYVRIITGMDIRDTTAGFKCYTLRALSAVNLDVIHFKGYAFQICMKYAIIKHKYVIKEVPITFKDRLYGDSKMSSGIFKEALFGVWKMRKMKL